MPHTRWPSFLLILSTLILGCPGDDPVDALPGTDTDPSTGDGGACAPGQSLSCTCTGADIGVQVCRPDGSGYEPCTCETADDTGSTGATEGTDTGSTGATEGTDTGSTGATEGTDTGGSCGDGITDPGEDCDDGGESSACDVDCTVSACGDGVFNATAGELCDEGGPTALCDADCSPVECGDGLVNPAAGEGCDDAGESATCNVDCSISACGDGITNVSAGEVCDDMGESLTCDTDCSPSSCGDGITNVSAGEVCDDVGESAACDVDCTLATCGDGTVNATAGETCDGDALGGATCQSQGFSAGELACAPGCAAYDTTGCANPPGTPVLTLGFSAIKQFDFGWAAVPDADYYQLEESAAPGEPFVQLGADIVGTSVSHTMPLHFRYQASYRLRACNLDGCTDSAVVDVVSSLAEAVGYFKSSNSQTSDLFGWSVALSADGSTLAVGAIGEDSSATGIGGDQANNAAVWSGAVYVFVQDGLGGWSQQAYVKASNPEADDYFGQSVALSADGSTLAVGAHYEDSNATGIDGSQGNVWSFNSGAVYVFGRDGMGTWSQQAYVKASNSGAGDWFGWSVAISGDGDTLAVGAYNEDSNATGIGGDQANNLAGGAGAVYLY